MGHYLGIMGYSPNSAAAILRDGEIVAFAEEERFNRIKTSPGVMPIASILYCLEEARIGFDELDGIGFGWDSPHYAETMPAFYDGLRERYPDPDPTYNALYEQALLVKMNPEYVRADLCQGLALRGHRLDPNRIRFLPHHLCHAASTYFASGFEDAAVVTVDGSGEESTTHLWNARGHVIDEIERFLLPHSLGGYYATFTEFLGFRANRDEGKLMGLAAFGEYSESLQRKLDQVLTYDEASGRFEVNPYMRHVGKRSYGRRFTDAMVDLFGSPRLSHQRLEDEHRDLAFNVQYRLEAVMKALTKRALASSGSRNLCLAGGVAMNCKMNGALAGLDGVDRIFVQPASSDNGIALGAAYLLAREAGVETFAPMRHAYYGPAYSDAQIENALRESKLAYRKSADTTEEVADALANGKIVGWFQGRMEFGARALGGRSILANPLIENMRDKINAEVKHREGWRPFCPSILAERYYTYFEKTCATSDYMILAFPVREEYQELIPAAVHVDGTARPQAVHRDTNPRYHALIEAFAERTGHPVLINTSFNVQGEPVVCTPQDALRCFGGTGIDLLVMNDFIVEKG